MFNKIVSDAKRALVAKTGALPVVTGIYHALNGKLMLNDFYQNRVGYTAVLGTECGFDVLVLDSGSDGYCLRLNNRIAGDHRSDATLLTKTGNIKYLIRTVQVGSVRNKIEEAIKDAGNYVNARLSNVVHRYRRKHRPEARELRLSGDTANWLLDVYFGKAQTTSTPAHIQSKLEEALTNNNSNKQLMDEYCNKAKDMFAKEKWLMFYRISRQDDAINDVMIGSIQGYELYDRAVDSNDTYNYPVVRFTSPLTLYRGLEAIDPAIRDEIMGKLTMIKVFRERNYPDVRTIDTDHYIPINSDWGNSGVITFDELSFVSETTASSVCMLFDK